ncbi:MAG TPA: hypothetical protein VFM88_10500 [Vicinamibacteria bacterium]|nr:hypothetical protein [Vicinamibacteria bacterium]
MRTTTLDPSSIARTVELLRQRIEARFPEAGLGRVAGKLAVVARKAQETSEWIDRPILGLRIAVGALIVLIVLGLGVTVSSLRAPAQALELGQFIQVLEAGINDVVLIGAAVFFLATLETRIKRRRALQAIHELRAIAHIVDMHQLTKDPEWVLTRGQSTGVVERRDMTAFELSRYLDYCSEMLALTGKIAAVYIQRFEDGVALQAVNEVEDLTTGLSRKIWQKLMVLYALEERRVPRGAGA